ncbi:MAG: restriction endonuclease subunit S, partial [Liquorilactobacillus sp.]
MADIKPWLNALGFDENNELTIKGNTISIDLDATDKNINYPQLKEIGRNTTTNLSSPENFVVLEAIIGLLKQGYQPNQISIEKGYKLGHDTKSGNADITVDNNEGNPFFIIEAKTYGGEFEKEWSNTARDGGQLFSYEKQDNKAQVLVLYSSRVINESIERVYHAVSLNDNEDFLSTLDNPRGYKDAKGGNDKFEIWRDTYQQDYVTNGVLEENIAPFTFGKPKSSTDDLNKITHDEVRKKYNQFATILRKYNVGGRENAFDKLVNLFLAKIVDEQQNSDDLQFNWKGVAQDTYFELVDRLQKLYQVGMGKFLDEKVSYVSEKDVVDSFRLKKDAAKEAILKYFKELKYFSNNDFTFLDVYNEQLFYQNSKILVEIVQMLQDMKLKTKEQNQFLSDLFEGFLDNGVKQSEGQFFTPLPIVKFIVSSLPLEKINNSTDIPKVIDYASGSGHFLNEYAEEIKKFVTSEKLPDYYSEIYGIEKEYRLSKVSKVSAFMYGQDDINIVYGDALVEHEGVNNNSYSVIVANPPYSVKGFLGTLTERQRANYELNKFVDKIDTNNSIELFFLERAKQLLKSQGVAGIIVPSSVLSNGNLYSKSRKMLIENFDIIAIAEFGSKTFGSTGTNTVTLFLQKKQYPPKESDNYKYAVERWFSDTDVLDEDRIVIQDYCNLLGIEYEDYCELQDNTLDRLLENELFEEYVENFEKSANYKRISKKKVTARYSKEERDTELERAKISYVKDIEQEKATYFAIANAQIRDVVIVKSPTDNSGMKQFLGYEWSKRKGQEGIKYIGKNISDEDMETSKNQAINNIQTPLFNPNNLMDEDKINSVIRNNFNGELNVIPTSLDNFANTSTLVDMLDFTRTSFDTQIKTTSDKKIKIISKYPLEKLGKIANVQKGTTITQAQTKEGNIKVVAGGIDYAYTHDTANRSAEIITISASGANAGFVNYWDEPIFASDTITVQTDNKQETQYIYNFLKSRQNLIFELARGAAQPHVYPKDVSKIPIPQVPDDVQKKIIESVEKLDEKYETSRMKIEDYRKQISEIFQSLDILRGAWISLGKVGEMQMCKRIYAKETTSSGDVPFYKIGTLGKAPDAFITREKYEEYRTKYPFPKKGDVLISASGTIGKTFVYDGEDAYFQDSNIVWIENDEKLVSNEYLAKVLPYINWTSSDGSTIKRLYSRDLYNTQLPVFNNQKEVINKISSLESEISTEESIM